MVLLTRRTLREYYEKHPNSKEALSNFASMIEHADWSNFHEMKQDFGSVDSVGNDRYIFNIRGTTYRLIALIIFQTRTFYIRFIGTHAAYDKIKDASVT